MLPKIIRWSLILIASTLIFIFGVLYGTSLRQTRRDSSAPGETAGSSPSIKGKAPSIFAQQARESFSHAYNGTHLWSMRLADENYNRVARLVPCRSVEYVGGPRPEKMDTCDPVTQQEFSIESTLHAQQWLYEHQHPADCSKKKIAILHQYAWSGFGSTIHQIVWAVGLALSQDRIVVYQTPGNWLYGMCPLGTPDCIFLPISNCSVPSTVDGDRVVLMKANIDHWFHPVYPPVFKNRTHNWVRSQLLFYVMRYNGPTLAHVHSSIAKYFDPPSVDAHRPYVAVYVRRSDKVRDREMSRAYSLAQYFKLFDADARRAGVSKVYVNSEDENVFTEYKSLFNATPNDYYKLLSVKATRNVVFMGLVGMSLQDRGRIVLEFLTDLFIEANADLHAGTLTSNWCRIVDEMRFVLGKILPFYTPENRYLIDV